MLCTKFSIVIYTFLLVVCQIYEFYFKRIAQFCKYYALNKQVFVFQFIIMYYNIVLLSIFDKFLQF
ncbi:hypothetical protein CTM63_07725 [Prevotella intermedia]|nr:hypothetical protein CTM63_07725 [Prevotella intermedia]